MPILTVSQRAKDGLSKSSAEDFAESYLTYRLVKGSSQEKEFAAMYPNRWRYLKDIEDRSKAGTL